jgi:hypothetical protein
MIELTNPANGEIIEIYESDIDNTLDWSQSIKIISNLGSDWRLPSIFELKIIHSNLFKNNLGNFKKHMTYWSSDNDGYNFQVFTFGGDEGPFNDGTYSIKFYPKEGLSLFVRPVRTKINPSIIKATHNSV